MSAEVTTQVLLDEGQTCGRGRFTVLRLCWRASDPLAVNVLVAAKPDHPALPRGQWVILRDVLRRGLTEPAGVGEVRVEPNDGAISLTLKGDARRYMVRVPAHQIHEFLNQTDEIVAPGTESCEASLTAALNSLLEAGDG